MLTPIFWTSLNGHGGRPYHHPLSIPSPEENLSTVKIMRHRRVNESSAAENLLRNQYVIDN